MSFLFTSESVTMGHPDKVADRIADAILDALITRDPNARLGCEIQVSPDQVALAGEMRLNGLMSDEDIAYIVRNTIRDIGYDREDLGFSADTITIINNMHQQSPDIAQGVDSALDEEREIGAGDNGIMFGYATNEHESLMPLPIVIAHALAKRLDHVRRWYNPPMFKGLRPDGKVQITIEYSDDMKPLRATTIVVCQSHDEDVNDGDFKAFIAEEVVGKVMGEFKLPYKRLLVNPTGRFVVCGPFGDAGCVGRKIVVDQYGGMAPVGGGSLIGKDPTKVDRSGVYAARQAAKSLVANGFCGRCLVQVAYAIGVARPVSLMVNSYGTVKYGYKDEDLATVVAANFDMRPGSIIRNLELQRPIYENLANYGQLGRRESEAPWEKVVDLGGLQK